MVFGPGREGGAEKVNNKFRKILSYDKILRWLKKQK